MELAELLFEFFLLRSIRFIGPALAKTVTIEQEIIYI
jgi:hypothetical protein